MLSYVDVFHVLMVAIFVCLPLVLLMEGRKGDAPGAAP
jgi:hypothetical protein